MVNISDDRQLLVVAIGRQAQQIVVKNKTKTIENIRAIRLKLELGEGVDQMNMLPNTHTQIDE